jgi:hypothetical protein
MTAQIKRITSFQVRLARPQPLTLASMLTALSVDGRPPLRWAIVDVDGEWLVVAGARLSLT